MTQNIQQAEQLPRSEAPARAGRTRLLRAGGAIRRRRSGLATACVILAVLVIWEVLARVGAIDLTFMSSPSAVLSAAGELGQDGEIRAALWRTVQSVIEAFLIGTLLGIIVGIVLGVQRTLREAYLPIIMILVGVPKSTFLPIIVLFTGLNAGPSIVFGAMLAFLYATVNVVGGIDSIDPRYQTVASAFGATFWRRVHHVIIPGATPGVFAAIWHGLRSAFEGVLIGELFASTGGIGLLVITFSNSFEFANVYMLQIAVAVILIAIGSGWSRVESRMTTWRKEETNGTSNIGSRGTG